MIVTAVRSILKYSSIFILATFLIFFLVSLSRQDSPEVMRGYAGWLQKLAHLDAGEAYEAGRKPADFLLERLKNTLLLSIGAVSVSTVFAIGMGLLLLKGHRRLFRALEVCTYMATTIPVFLLCYMMEAIAFRADPDFLPTNDAYNMWFIVLGVFVLGIGNNALGDISRGVSAEIETIMGKAYLNAAKARGVSIWKHTAKALLLTTMNMVSSRLILTVGTGVIIVEYVFRIQGIGLYILGAPESGAGRDVILLITGVLIGIVCIMYLINDLVRMMLDRRGSFR